MTWFQWFIICWTGLGFLIGAHYHGKQRTGAINLSDVVIRLALINWMLWYAGAWN